MPLDRYKENTMKNITIDWEYIAISLKKGYN